MPKLKKNKKMRSKTVKAIFKGQDGSCGYVTNKEYTIKIYHGTKMYIQIENLLGRGSTNYGSLVAFLENWDNIRNI